MIDKYNDSKIPDYYSILFILDEIVPYIEPDWMLLAEQDYEYEHNNKPLPKKQRDKLISIYRTSIILDMVNKIKEAKMKKTPSLMKFLSALDELLDEWDNSLNKQTKSISKMIKLLQKSK